MSCPSVVDKKDLTKASADMIDEEAEALAGYIVDPQNYPDNASGLKTSADGRFVLIPQPLDSPDDPLNWSSRKKWFIVVVIAYIATLADYTGGTAISTIIPQSSYVSILLSLCALVTDLIPPRYFFLRNLG